MFSLLPATEPRQDPGSAGSLATEEEEVGPKPSSRGEAVITQVKQSKVLCCLRRHWGGGFFEPHMMLPQIRPPEQKTTQPVLALIKIIYMIEYVFLVFNHTNKTVCVHYITYT